MDTCWNCGIALVPRDESGPPRCSTCNELQTFVPDELPRCSACGNPYHEATGHRWTDRTVLCGACAREWLAWRKRHEQGKWGKVRFYDHTLTSREKT